MGFDLYGLKKLENEDNYFRNNCWYWRPLWALCLVTSSISLEDFNGGKFNDGYKIDEEKANNIANALEEYIKDEDKVNDYIKIYPVLFGYERDNYPFDIENVKNFIEFCKKSGGFEIY